MLLGRERELGAVLAVCRGAAVGRGSVLVVSGEPGIGKTALLAAAGEASSECDVVRATGVEAESAVAFATLQGLLWPLRDRLDELDASQAGLLRGILELGPTVGASTFTVGAATLALLSVAAEPRPIIALVDDVQWSDVASQEVLCFIGRRLEQERVVVLAGLREGEPSLLADERSFARLRLEALDTESARSLLERSSPDQLAANVLESLLDACAGSPLGLIELPLVLTEAQRRGEEPLPAPLAAGPLVQRAFAARASTLDAAARRALLLLAASGDASVALLARVGVEQEAIDAVESSGLIARRTEILVFRHPLVQSAVFSAATPDERRKAHGALAAAVDGSRRAWHLAGAAAGPDESVAEALEASAADARFAGGLAAEAQALERAAALTPDAERRAGRLLGAAQAWRRAGRSEHAEALLRDALRLADDAVMRARIQLEQADLLYHHYEMQASYDLLLAQAEHMVPVDPKLASRILVTASRAGSFRLDSATTIALAERALALVEGDGGTEELDAEIAVIAARMLLMRPPDERDIRLVARAAARLERPARRAACDEGPWIAYCLALHERDEAARSLSDQLLADARAAGDVLHLSYRLCARAALEQATGRLDSAWAFAAESLALSREIGDPFRISEAYWILAEVESARGNVAETREALGSVHERTPWNEGWALGIAHLACGQFEQAIPYLGASAEQVDRGEVARAWYHQVPLELAEAYVRAGRRHDADVLLRRHADAIERCPLARPRAKLARVRALGAPEATIDTAFAAALSLLDEVPQHLERGRVELGWGERLRESGRSADAVVHLEHALARFDALGAVGWAERARRELESASGSTRAQEPRRSDVLTAQELRVSQHAAAGLRDREIAALLYLSPRTVESYLHNAYRKLDVSNRTQLAGVLAGDGVHAVPLASGTVGQVP